MGLTTINADSDSEDKGGFFSSFLVFNEYKRGNVAVISQSGMLNGGYFTYIIEKYPELGFRYSCSIGNKMDIGELEFLDYFLQDETVNVIAIYLESFDNPRKFIELCKKAKNYQRKTIILVKGGLTMQGRKATLSHTASISENNTLTKALIKQAGIIKANSFSEMFEYARTFSFIYNSNKTLPEEGGLSIIVGSGGAGTILSDLTVQYGFTLPQLSERSYSILKEIFPTWMPPNRFALVDIWPAMEKAMTTKRNPNDVMKAAFKAVLSEQKVEGLINMMFCSKQFRAMSNVDVLIDVIKNYSKPVFFFLIGEHQEINHIARKLSKHNIPSFSNLENIVKNFRALLDESINNF
jgi:acyl-CoA synthetase (NDP forming)